MLTAKNIRTIRMLNGMRQEDLAEKTGLSFSLISSIERGVRRITCQSEKRIREALSLNDQLIQHINDIEAGIRR
ncbi:helix-turn-helix domain-containing protein [Paenibacillus sp. GYB003]|uniref:helix-turn-helix domain-containing protein n=1 Tax=Paenibacillus sp. GYB003 TaxID=2994392 RepID=UPI002F967AEE